MKKPPAKQVKTNPLHLAFAIPFAGMLMVMLVSMDMIVGMGHTVMGVLMGVGMLVFVGVGAGTDVIVMQMHKNILLFHFFFIITANVLNVKAFILVEYPPEGLAKNEKKQYTNKKQDERGVGCGRPASKAQSRAFP